MKTTKPIATISYNTLPFLVARLDSLVKNDIISFYAVIEHFPEEDEKKSHCHVYLEPAKAVDTIWLHKQFIEVDPLDPEHPLKSLPIERSKFVDWYWYGLHDKAYLASKNQARKYHYSSDDMMTSDRDALDEKVRLNPNPKSEILRAYELMERGYTPIQIAVQMNVPMRNLRQFLAGVYSLGGHIEDLTDRNGKIGHEGVYQIKGGKEDDE